LVALLSSCAPRYSSLLEEGGLPYIVIEKASILELQNEELLNLKPAKRKPVIAVYPNSFKDMTGQRRSNSQFALFSTAITQAPEALLIRALKHASNGEFFQVAERVGLDSLTKERQLIRSTRETFDEESAVKPLLLAGLLVQGAVLSIDSNIRSGGMGARYLGIGSSKEYREDLITISLRLVSVSTGEVLIEVLINKSIISVGLSQDLFRFISNGTELVEIEGGAAENESTSIALQQSIEQGVLQIIKIGISKGYWEYEEIN
jgi:curli production assembly/transport component CsgG|tara:strand:+ start:1085 stop:1870 length:786 start_codon:yes stop_codon:yes gene_type:complete